MNSRDLTPEQLQPINEKMRQMTAYLRALKARMEATGFPVDDELYRLTKELTEKVQDYRMSLHYLECDARRRK